MTSIKHAVAALFRVKIPMTKILHNDANREKSYRIASNINLFYFIKKNPNKNNLSKNFKLDKAQLQISPFILLTHIL